MRMYSDFELANQVIGLFQLGIVTNCKKKKKKKIKSCDKKTKNFDKKENTAAAC